MADKYQETAKIIRQEELADGIFSIWFATEHIASIAKPGQFIAIYSKDGSRLLPRPISICEIDYNSGALHVVYRVAGKGTEEFSGYHAGESLRIMGPLGNGFPLLEGNAMVIGGGIGIPPMLELAKQLRKKAMAKDPESRGVCGKVTAVLGYRDELFLNEKFEEIVRVAIATEDGNAGTKGTVLDAIREQNLHADVIYACGPLPMLRAVKEYAAEKNITCYVSLEEKMGCGIGACLACVCKTREKDRHSNVNNTRICKEGPVFLAEEVDF